MSNTGPLISAFQSKRVDILRQLYDVVFITTTELSELHEHGVSDEIRELMEAGFIIVHALTDPEQQTARQIAVPNLS